MPPKELWNGDNPPTLPFLPFSSNLPFETVERRVEISTEEWARDLRSLFEHSKERFGDVSWESEGGEERVWGHKGEFMPLECEEVLMVAIIYARAPSLYYSFLLGCH